MRNQYFQRLLVLTLAFTVAAGAATAQTSAFTYQGKLNVAGTPTNGQYDLVFTLYDLDKGGLPVASEQIIEDVQVTNGIFTVELGFDFAPFTNIAANWIEVGVRPGASTGSFTTLSPRQHLTSAPYAMQTAFSVFSNFATNATNADNADAVGGTPAAQIIKEGDPRLTDARQPMAGNSSYVQVSPGSPQSGGFDVLGNGKIGSSLTVFGATFLNSSLSVGGSIAGNGSAIINIDPNNLSSSVPVTKGGTGIAASGSAGNVLRSDGSSWTSSPIQASDIPAGSTNYIRNSGVAQSASFNVSGGGTVGGTLSAGFVNATNYYSLGGTRFASINGNHSTFIGESAGQSNFGGTHNTYIGYASQSLGIGGTENTFIGSTSGLNNSGSNNFFGGVLSGWQTTSGDNNTFVGSQAGSGNLTGDSITLIGRGANVTTGDLFNATAIGASALVAQNNSLVLGNGAKVGIGTSSPATPLHVVGVTYITGPLILKSFDGGCHQIVPQNGSTTTVLKVQQAFCPDAPPLAPGSNDRPAESSLLINDPAPSVNVAPTASIIRSPNGTCWEITVNDQGVIAAVPAKKCE